MGLNPWHETCNATTAYVNLRWHVSAVYTGSMGVFVLQYSGYAFGFPVVSTMAADMLSDAHIRTLSTSCHYAPNPIFMASLGPWISLPAPSWRLASQEAVYLSAYNNLSTNTNSPFPIPQVWVNHKPVGISL